MLAHLSDGGVGPIIAMIPLSWYSNGVSRFAVDICRDVLGRPDARLEGDRAELREDPFLSRRGCWRCRRPRRPLGVLARPEPGFDVDPPAAPLPEAGGVGERTRPSILRPRSTQCVSVVARPRRRRDPQDLLHPDVPRRSSTRGRGGPWRRRRGPLGDGSRTRVAQVHQDHARLARERGRGSATISTSRIKSASAPATSVPVAPATHDRRCSRRPRRRPRGRARHPRRRPTTVTAAVGASSSEYSGNTCSATWGVEEVAWAARGQDDGVTRDVRPSSNVTARTAGSIRRDFAQLHADRVLRAGSPVAVHPRRRSARADTSRPGTAAAGTGGSRACRSG